jgi:uracil-DNA glycosylase/two-component sensor histidine kinase
MLVGDFPTVFDQNAGYPFQNYEGELLSRLLAEHGIVFADCFRVCAMTSRPQNGDIKKIFANSKNQITGCVKYQDKIIVQSAADNISSLIDCIKSVNPNVILSFGEFALWALTGKSGIFSWRGSELVCTLDHGLARAIVVIPTHSMTSIFKQHELSFCVKRDIKRAASYMADGMARAPAWRFIISPKFQQAHDVLQSLIARAESGRIEIAVDIEPRSQQIACIGLAWSEKDAICLPLMDANCPLGYWSSNDEIAVLRMLTQLLTHPNCLLIGHGFTYDAQFFSEHLCLDLPVFCDTLVVQHVLEPTLPKSLSFTASIHCDQYVFWKDDGKLWDESTGEKQLWFYNCEDACRTWESHREQKKLVELFGMEQIVDKQMLKMNMAYKMMINGLHIDSVKLHSYKKLISKSIQSNKAWINKVIGRSINIGSSAQLADLFYNELGQAVITNSATGLPSCDAEALAKIAKNEAALLPVVECIQKIRKLEPYYKQINTKVDYKGFNRFTFNISGSSDFSVRSGPNAFGVGFDLHHALNLTKYMDDYDIFSIIKPGDLKSFISIKFTDDFAARIVALQSLDLDALHSFSVNSNPYVCALDQFMESSFFQNKDEAGAKLNNIANMILAANKPSKISNSLRLPLIFIKNITSFLLASFPSIATWHKSIGEAVRCSGFVHNAFGYRMPVHERRNDSAVQNSISWLIESTKACLMYEIHCRINNNLAHVDAVAYIDNCIILSSRESGMDELLNHIKHQTDYHLTSGDHNVYISTIIKTSSESLRGVL